MMTDELHLPKQIYAETSDFQDDAGEWFAHPTADRDQEVFVRGDRYEEAMYLLRAMVKPNRLPLEKIYTARRRARELLDEEDAQT